MSEAAKLSEYPATCHTQARQPRHRMHQTLAWCKDIAKHESDRLRTAHLPADTDTNAQATYGPEAINTYQCNVAEAQLKL